MSAPTNDAIALSPCDSAELLVAENHRLRGENEALRLQVEELEALTVVQSKNERVYLITVEALNSEVRRLREVLRVCRQQ